MREVSRVFKTVIYPTNEYYALFLEGCHNSKNLYNRVMYVERQCFFNNEKIKSNYTISKLLQDDLDYPDYKKMFTAQSAQQTIKQAVDVWKSYLKAKKAYKEDPEKFTGEPRFPRYKEKDGYFPLTFTNQNCKLKGNIITFPKSCKGYTITVDKEKIDGFKKLSEIKIVPKKDYLLVLVTYTKKIFDVSTKKSKHILGIDIGLNNLASCVDNKGIVSFIIDGRYLKSINQGFNKVVASYSSKLERVNNLKTSKHLRAMCINRANKVENYLQKATRKIINICKKNKIDTIIVGYNEGWKTRIDLSKRFNQNFNYMAFRRLLDILKYKCEDEHIIFIETEESFTSKTSFIDHEQPIKGDYKKRRVKRGLFKSNEGVYINADINGAYQIINKRFKCEYKEGFKRSGYKIDVLN